MRPPRDSVMLVIVLIVLATNVVLIAARTSVADRGTPSASETPKPAPSPSTRLSVKPPAAIHAFVDRTQVGHPWGEVAGLLQFRGNPTHTWYGTGPVPTDPQVIWRYPERPMCSTEVIGQEQVVRPNPGPSELATETVAVIKRWCGTGWTGQPAVWERPDGITEVIFGAYDKAVHFLDAATGMATRPPFQTGGLIKGSVTIDPNGFPLLYFGSRDNYLRVVALDRDVPTELWKLHAHQRRIWNNDWDGNPSVINDMLIEGGEDGWFYVIKLNRSLSATGVQVAPEILVEVPGWNDELLAAVGDRNVSIENSVAVFEGTAYFANSGGRVVGVDLTHTSSGDAPIVFDFWLGDDVDASLVIDEEGMLYASVELERMNARAATIGQLVKLDPSRAPSPVVWSIPIPPRLAPGVARDDGGSWSTPALADGVLWVSTHPGDLLAVDASTGKVLYREDIGYHEWSSPAVVDGTLIVALCEKGGLRAYDIADASAPTVKWEVSVPSGSCVESTPAVWNGHVYVGSRDGFFYSFG